MANLPYQNLSHENNIIIRCIQEASDDFELKWHRDLYDRKVIVISGENWMLQFENDTPFFLEKGKEYFIKKDQWHRVIKGKNDLFLEIKEIP